MVVARTCGEPEMESCCSEGIKSFSCASRVSSRDVLYNIVPRVNITALYT